jgi:hypothetical protein
VLGRSAVPFRIPLEFLLTPLPSADWSNCAHTVAQSLKAFNEKFRVTSIATNVSSDAVPAVLFFIEARVNVPTNLRRSFYDDLDFFFRLGCYEVNRLPKGSSLQQSQLLIATRVDSDAAMHPRIYPDSERLTH